jgi:hypothetical protein
MIIRGAVLIIAITQGACANGYNITDAERSACSVDAVRLCSAAYPDEDKLLSCMRANRNQLTSPCRTVFDAGLKSRHLTNSPGVRFAR